MARFTEIGPATIPGKGTRLRLLQRNDEFPIRIAGITLASGIQDFRELVERHNIGHRESGWAIVLPEQQQEHS